MQIRLLLTLPFLLLGSALCASETISGADPSVKVIGRYLSSDEGCSFDWSGTTLMLRFTGKSLTARVSDTGADYFNLWIDSRSERPDRVIRVSGRDSLVTLFSSAKRGTHTLILQKRTEGEQGKVTFHSFVTDGKFESAPQPRGRLIEFIGDSYTCGYGTEASSPDEPFTPETENPSLTYADILGRFFDAETVHISHSGRGVIRNYDGAVPGQTMPLLYGRVFDSEAQPLYEPSYAPDVVVIYLGTNDFSTGFQPALSYWCQVYDSLLQQVRENYGSEVPIVCVASPCDELMGFYVEEAVRRSGLSGVYSVSIRSGCYNYESDLGASSHPNYSGQRKVASAIAPYIATATGWEFPLKVLE